MAGKKGRSGRHKPYDPLDVTNLSTLSMRTMIHALKDPAIPLIDRARLVAPIVAKRFPEIVQQTTVTLSLDSNLLERLSALYSDYLERLPESAPTLPDPPAEIIPLTSAGM